MINILYALVLISSIALIALMLVQEGSDQNSMIMGVAPEALWGRDRGVSRDATLKRMTVVSAAVFFVTAFLLSVF